MSATAALEDSLRRIISQNLGSLAGVQGSLLGAAGGRPVKSVLVTSSHPREGKTTSAVSMAFALAGKTGASVLLVDGNLNAPRLHEVFGLTARPGFSEFLAGQAEAVDAMRKTSEDNLTVMPHGAAHGNILEYYRSASFERVLASLAQKFDYVVYDGQSVLGDSDASVVARFFDGVALVVECERTRWEVVQEVKDRLTRAGGKLLGAVLNKRRFYIPQAFYGRY